VDLKFVTSSIVSNFTSYDRNFLTLNAIIESHGMGQSKITIWRDIKCAMDKPAYTPPPLCR